jgi:hypothetical protein
MGSLVGGEGELGWFGRGVGFGGEGRHAER